MTICGRRAENITQVAARLGDRCLAVTADVTQAEDRADLVRQALAHGGGLDGLVSNAGNMYRAPIAEFDQDRLLDIFNQNVISGMMLSQLVVPALAARQGSIVFLGLDSYSASISGRGALCCDQSGAANFDAGNGGGTWRRESSGKLRDTGRRDDANQ